MKTDDLLDPTNEEITNSDNVENDATGASNEQELTKNENLDFLEEKKESAAELIIKKLEQSRLKKQEKGNILTESEISNIQVNTPAEELSINIDEIETGEIVDYNNLEHVSEEHEEVDFDYSTLSQEELVAQLKSLLEKSNIQKTKNQIEAIKVNFYKKHHADLDAAKKAFIEAGGVEEEFQAQPNAVEEEFKELYSVFREKRSEFNVNTEKDKQKNLATKYQIIEKIEQLTTGTESLNKTFHDFKELQKQWQEIGLVPQTEVKKLWDSYNYQVEKFYDYVKINKDLRDLDLKKNLELKIELCERAEKLLIEPKIVSAFRELQKLHSSWREIGPVPVDKKDELWER
jgi:hypothetical protein